MTEPFLFAQRTDWPLAANQLSADLERLRKNSIPVLDLTESNPTHCHFSYPDNIVKSLSEEENLYYTPAPKGNLNAREAVSRYYEEKGFNVSPEQIFLTASTSEAYSYLFRLVANSGEQVLFPRPSYPLFSFLGDLNDVRMETYPLVYNGKWNIDLEEMRQAFCDDTKALVLVNPNNPTGSFVRRQELKEINALCREHQTVLICDEVFADFAFDQNGDYVSERSGRSSPTPHPEERRDEGSLAGNNEVLTFVLGGVSKTLGLPQMKLSWIILNGPRDLVDAAAARLEVIADTYLSVNTPTQNALPGWLSHRNVIQDEINARLRQNVTFLREHTAMTKECELLAVEGGWYAVLKVPDTHSEEEWALMFLNKDHVFVHPGYFFDFDTEPFVIISLLPPCATFQEGIKRILGRIQSFGS